MEELSYGFELPETGDLSSVWMPAIENSITQLNSHTHNGTNSSLLTPASISRFTSTITALSYTNDGGGNYSKVITVPSGITEINSYLLQFYITATGTRIYPTVERVTATTYRIRLNQELALTAVYG